MTHYLAHRAHALGLLDLVYVEGKHLAVVDSPVGEHDRFFR